MADDSGAEPATGAIDGVASGGGDEEGALEGSHVDSLPHLSTLPGVGGRLKVRNADFVVEEILPEGVPDGKDGGAFVVVAVEREGAATFDVQRELAALFGVRDAASVAYAGLKDKDAVVTQHFSLPVGPGSVSKDKARLPSHLLPSCPPAAAPRRRDRPARRRSSPLRRSTMRSSGTVRAAPVRSPPPRTRPVAPPETAPPLLPGRPRTGRTARTARTARNGLPRRRERPRGPPSPY